jgi:hypothetical protein
MAVTAIIVAALLAVVAWLCGASFTTVLAIYVGWRLLKLAFRLLGLLLRMVLAIIGILMLIGLLALVA